MQRVNFLLRLGLSIPFFIASVGALISPNDWLWYIPDWLVVLFPADTLLLGHGIFELLLGMWLLSGKKTLYAALIACGDLTINTLLNIQTFNVVFRDIGLIFTAVALAALHLPVDTKSQNKKSPRLNQR